MHALRTATPQKSTAPVAAPNTNLNQPAARITPPAATAHATPVCGGPDPTCFVHHLEEALLLVESMKLTDDQQTKISQLATAQKARCAEAKKQHTTTHEQILALLTPDQHQKLQAAADHSSHCHEGVHAVPAELPGTSEQLDL